METTALVPYMPIMPAVIPAQMNNIAALQNKINLNYQTINTSISVYHQNLMLVVQGSRQAESSTQKAAGATENMANATNKAKTESEGLMKQVSKLLPLSKVIKDAWKGTMAALTEAGNQKGQEAKFQALVGNKTAGNQLYDYAAQYAKGSTLSKDQVVGAISSAMPFTRDIKQIEQMVKFAERLNALDPSKGFDSAMGAVTSMMQGDTSSVKKSYGVNVDEKQLKGRRSAGDSEGMLTLIDEGLSGAGATEELVGERFALLGAQVSEFKDGFMAAIGEAAVPVMESLAQVVMRLNEDFQAGKYQPVINMLVGGMELIGTALAFLAENADKLIPIIGGLVIAITAYNTAMAISKILSGNLFTMFATAAAVGLTIGIVNEEIKAAQRDAEKEAAKKAPTPSADALREYLDGKMGTPTMDVNIANSDPVKVTGEVDIEKENLKYMLDIAGARFFAIYSTATMAPQVTVQNMQVNQTADADSLLGYVADGLATASAAAPQGVYGGK